MSISLDLLLTDELTLWPLTHGLRDGQVTPPGGIRWLAPAAAEAALPGEGLLWLVPTAAYARVGTSHVAIADLAIVSQFQGAAALLTAQRPDLLAAIELDVRDVSETTELLARIVVRQHIGADDWSITRQPAPGAPARLVEGAAAVAALSDWAALQATTPVADDPPAHDESDDDTAPDDEVSIVPSGHYVEILARDWFILTGLPWVSHLALVERSRLERDPAAVITAVACLRQCLARAQAQPRVVAQAAADHYGLDATTLRAHFQDQRHALDATARRAVGQLFLRANRAAGRPLVPELAVVEV